MRFESESEKERIPEQNKGNSLWCISRPVKRQIIKVSRKETYVRDTVRYADSSLNHVIPIQVHDGADGPGQTRPAPVTTVDAHSTAHNADYLLITRSHY